MGKLTTVASVAGPAVAAAAVISYISITNSANSIYEGEGNVVFTVATAGLTNGTTLYYTIHQQGGTVNAASFASNSMTGSFAVNNNIGTFTLDSALESNTTDDYFNVTVSASLGGNVVLTSANVKIVDLTSYNATLATYNTGYGGQTISYSIGGTTAGASAGVSTGTTGSTTTLTFQGTTITAYGGQGGKTTDALGGSYTGGNGGYEGGSGSLGNIWAGPGSAINYTSSYGGGGGGTGGSIYVAYGGYITQNRGGAWANSYTQNYINTVSANGIYAFLTTASPNGLGLATALFSSNANIFGVKNSGTYGYQNVGDAGPYFGGGGGGYSGTKSLSAPHTGFTATYGGAGGIGGGGGGAAVAVTVNSSNVYTFTAQAGGAGGQGVVVLKYVQANSNITGALTTSGSSTTVPANTVSITAWAIGGGGSGAGSTVVNGSPMSGRSGGGGGGGGIVYKTWSLGSPPTKPSL